MTLVEEFVFRNEGSVGCKSQEPLFVHELPRLAQSQIGNWDNEPERQRFLFSYLHLLTHRLLQKYMNGATGGRYWLPLKFQNCYVSGLLRDIAQVLSALETDGFISSQLTSCIRMLVKQGKASALHIAEIISALYTMLDKYKSAIWQDALVEKHAVVEGYRLWQNKARSRVGLAPIHALKQYIDKHLHQDLAGFYLHGSFATLDYVYGYSDCDTLAIIQPAVIKNPKRLQELRMKLLPCHTFLFRIDSLQHHGIFVLAEDDFKWYPQAFFPLILFKKSVSLHSAASVNISVKTRPDLLEKWDYFMDHRKFLLNAVKNPNAIDSLYQLKRLVQNFIMSPCLYLQIVDDYYCKKDALVKLKIMPKTREAIDIATYIRETLIIPPLLPSWIYHRLSHWNPATLFGLASHIKRDEYQQNLTNGNAWAHIFLAAVEYLYVDAKKTLAPEEKRA